MLELDYQVMKILNRSNDIKVGDISKKINIPHSTIGSCVKRLTKKGFVRYKPYQPVILTEKGRDLAIELNRHAHLLEMLLVNELKIKADDAHRESDKFNLLLSCEVINKICERYGHPKKCPCGEEILSSSFCICKNKD